MAFLYVGLFHNVTNVLPVIYAWVCYYIEGYLIFIALVNTIFFKS